MDGHYAESQQSEERLEEEGSVSRSRETGPAAASDYGAHSPVGFCMRHALSLFLPPGREKESSLTWDDELLCSLQRPARSQISTAVSFEPAHPASSAANAARSGEDSAASAAEPEGVTPCLFLPPLFRCML